MDEDGPREGLTDATRASLERSLGGQYRILRLLGRGGMGAVYLARDEALERLVAIKVLRAELAPTDEGRERFRREARTAAQLSHSNIAPLLSFGEVEGLMYLVMGYVRGEPLSARLGRDGSLAPDEVRRIVADVAEALDYAHRKGVVHRDVKPDNILVDDETGRAVLTDFGIAKALAGGQTVTRLGAIVGTPHYMSPEQAAGQETLDGRSDIYSLGVVAYAMLAGRLPFEGASTQDVLVKRLTADGPSLTDAVPDAPGDLAAAVTRCLRRDPAARWADARALREAVSPSTLEADQLPEPLDTLDGMAPFVLPFALAFGASVVALLMAEVADPYRPMAPRPFAGPAGMTVILGGFIVGQFPMMWSAIRTARARGFSWRQIGAALMRQPEWWVGLWYPRRFRRAGDVWDRLPRPIRAWRIIVTALIADLVLWLYFAEIGPPLLMGRERYLVATRFVGERAMHAFAAVATAKALPIFVVLTFVSLSLALGVTAIFCARFMRRQGFDTYTLRRVSHTLITGPTSKRTPWKKPEVVQVLLPARHAHRRFEPRTAAEVVTAIVEAARALPAEVRALGEAAVTAARDLDRAIEAEDAAIARLSRNVDAAETARLRDRLTALQESKDPESRAMSELLARQLALLDEMTARLASAHGLRDRLLAALKTLGRAADELARTPDDGGAARRIRAATAEAEILLSRPPDETSEATRAR
ncbi:MAG TPA: serine/threonine-protein kinase [Vicinamibacteria bacterium]